MVNIVKRKKGNDDYYYLRHNIRRGKKEREIYIGKKIPKNIEELKQKFLLEFYREEWIPITKEIHKNFQKERKRMPKDIIKKELKNFAIKFIYNTQKIEGSTLTLKETADLLENGKTPANKPISDAKEAENHQKLFFELLKFKKDLSLEVMLSWHKKLFNDTKSDIAGKIRDYNVGIGISKFQPPRHQAVPLLLKGFFVWYNKNKKLLNPVELAALVHLKIVTIHPFGDGNGRISRLMMIYVLNRFEHPMLNIDYSNRNSYYNALERSQVKENDIHFLRWFMNQYFKTYSGFW